MWLTEKYILYNKYSTEIFQSLDKYLSSLQDYWQFEAFHHADYPWATTNANLSQFLENLSDTQVQLYQQYPDKLHFLLKDFIATLRASDDTLFHINDLNVDRSDIPFWLQTGIKGRKWSQITAFAQQIKTSNSIVEWCAGKGHLGRLISWQKQLPVTSIEWQANLCQIGQAEALKNQIRQSFKQADVLAGEADDDIKASSHVIALHACGDLHLHLIKQAIQNQPAYVTFSPCCYHLTSQNTYFPCSQLGQLSSLKISKQVLKLAVSKQSTSGKRQSRVSEQEVLWRLAFDELQKHALNSNDYCPLPSFPSTLLSGQFKAFVIWAKQQKSLTFDLPESLTPFLNRATIRLRKIRRMELVSQFFVRPLELWLVYDRALALQEAGYKVSVSTFCDENITPRNLLIKASLE